MEIVNTRCAGLDVHKKTVVACCLVGEAGKRVERQTQTFPTMTADLLRLADWLGAQGITTVAMESTGEFWKPVYALLEGRFAVLVVNAQHIKNVPGRKTDVKDAEWIADLLRHGLVRGSFIPPLAQRDLRDLTRQRTNLVEERAAVVNQLQKVLEWANLKLAGVATDITGVSARAMLEAIVAGEAEPTVLAELAQGRLRAKRAALEQALSGRVRAHHRFLLAEHLTHLDFLEEQIARFDDQITAHLASALPGSPDPLPPPDPPDPPAPAEDLSPRDPPAPPASDDLGGTQAVALLDTIPGVGTRVAEVLVAEVGLDMGRFGDARRLARWARLAPGNHQSAGKRLSGKIGNGNRALRSALVQAAHGAVKVKDCYLAQVYHRLAARRGRKRAIIAVAHRILQCAYRILLGCEAYQDYAPKPRAKPQVNVASLVNQLLQAGYKATLEPLPVGAA
jgi:transposase